MAGINIKNIPNAASLSTDDFVIVEQTTGTKKTSIDELTKTGTVVHYTESQDTIVLQKPDMIEKINNMESNLTSVSSQLEQNVQYLSVEYYKNLYSLSYADTINRLITENENCKIVLPKGIINLDKSIKITKSDICIEGNNTTLNFVGSDDDNCFSIGNNLATIYKIKIKDMTIIDTTKTLTAFRFNKLAETTTAVVNASLSDIRVEGALVGINSVNCWSNNFSDVRFHNCGTCLTLGNNSNSLLFSRCDFSNGDSFISLTNSDGVIFDTCNIVRQGIFFKKCFHSYVVFDKCYLEHNLDYGLIGATSQEFGSVVNIKSSFITGDNKIFNPKVSGLNYIIVNENTQCDNVIIQQNDNTRITSHLLQSEIQIKNNGAYNPKVINEWFGGTKLTFQPINKEGYVNYYPQKGYSILKNSSANGLILSDKLEIGNNYTLAIAVRTDDTYYFRHINSAPVPKVATTEEFKVFYIPFIAQTPQLTMFSNSQKTMQVGYIGLFEGTVFPKIEIGMMKIYEGTEPPTEGLWEIGDRVLNSTPLIGSPKGWVCTASGTPGTWVSEGNL